MRASSFTGRAVWVEDYGENADLRGQSSGWRWELRKWGRLVDGCISETAEPRYRMPLILNLSMTTTTVGSGIYTHKAQKESSGYLLLVTAFPANSRVFFYE